MSKIEVFSKKLGKTITIEAASKIEKAKKPSNTEIMGWVQSGWSNSGGW